MPEEDLEDLMVAVVGDAQDGLVNDRMPGQMPGDDMLEDLGEQLADAGALDDEARDVETAEVQDEDEEENEDEENEVAVSQYELTR